MSIPGEKDVEEDSEKLSGKNEVIVLGVGMHTGKWNFSDMMIAFIVSVVKVLAGLKLGWNTRRPKTYYDVNIDFC